MNRKEAMHTLKDIFDYFWIEIKDRGIDGELTEIMEVLEKPITLADFLGWEEGIKYQGVGCENCGRKYKIENGRLLYFNLMYEAWKEKDLDWIVENIENLRQAEKAEKQVAYYVRDKYSYDCLMKELEEQGYMWSFDEKATDVSYRDISKINTVIYCHENKTLRYSSLDYFNGYRKSSYNLIEYHKEPKPKAYHVKDEYSYDCLMQELEEQGYVCVNGFPLSTIRGYEDEYPYVIEKENKKIMRAEKDDHNFYGYDLIEYHKEEPKYYAIDRIGKLDNDNSYYLVRFYDEFYEKYYYGNTGKESADKLTKKEWAELGINDTNADWEEIEVE